MRVYETIVGLFRIVDGLSYRVNNNIGVKQGCPLSPTFFGTYMDDLEVLLRLHTHTDDNCWLYQIQIAILLFAMKAFIDSWMHLIVFCDHKWLLVNINKTKGMIFNTSRDILSIFHFCYRGEIVEITTVYI